MAADGCVWITGASTGLGRAIALRFAAAGHRVAASARNADQLESLAAEAEGTVSAHPLDVTDRTATAAAIDEIERNHGRIAIAILNAGTHLPMPAENYSAETVAKLLDVNVMGVAHGLDALLPRMIERRAGTIGVVSSVAGYRGLPTAAAYGASKAALINMCESLKLELDRHGVRLVLINPGFIDTPLTAKNPFPMPFLMPADKAAERVYRGLTDGRGFEITFPRRFTWMLKLLRMLPYGLYFAATRKTLP